MLYYNSDNTIGFDSLINAEPVDELYQGHLEGYTYTGNGYYSNNNLGSDKYVEIDRNGHVNWHRTM